MKSHSSVNSKKKKKKKKKNALSSRENLNNMTSSPSPGENEEFYNQDVSVRKSRDHHNKQLNYDNGTKDYDSSHLYKGNSSNQMHH